MYEEKRKVRRGEEKCGEIEVRGDKAARRAEKGGEREVEEVRPGLSPGAESMVRKRQPHIPDLILYKPCLLLQI